MAFYEMLKTWNIPKSKVHAILRDNARNMSKAMQDAYLTNLPSMAHTLQLAVNEGMLSQRSISDMVAMRSLQKRSALPQQLQQLHTLDCEKVLKWIMV